jgi:excisionase family DNA binding protein
MTRLLLTVPEAAEALAISRSKLYELLASGAIASIRIDGSRRIPLTALEEYVSRLLTERTAALCQTARPLSLAAIRGRARAPRSYAMAS